MKNKIIVLGGGTINPISNHLALCSPAFGSTANKIGEYLSDSEYEIEVVKTKLADPTSSIVSNEDLSQYVLENIILNDNVVGVVFNVAVCDFKYKSGDFHGERLSSESNITLDLAPDDKIISKIRQTRPDIFLVGFKTTTNKSINVMFEKGLKMMKSSKCNLVLCNDVVTRKNLVITPEETMYHITEDRDDALRGLTNLIKLRMNATYQRSKLVNMNGVVTPYLIPDEFRNILEFVISNGGFICNNGNGFTPGHFCIRTTKEKVIEYMTGDMIDIDFSIINDSEMIFLSSVRKANHNDVFTNGMCIVVVKEDGEFIVFGPNKASVGARSQYMLLKNNPEFDYILHTHNPLTPYSELHSVEQYPFQCGSNECGVNTSTNLKSYENDEIRAVYLEKHGVNMIFKHGFDQDTIKNFISNNIKLGEKVI